MSYSRFKNVYRKNISLMCNERKRGPRAAGTDVCGPCDLLATGDLKSLHTNIHAREREG